MRDIIFWSTISIAIISAILLTVLTVLAVKFHRLKYQQIILMDKYNRLDFNDVYDEIDILKQYAINNNVFKEAYIQLSKSVKHLNDGIKDEIYANIKSISKLALSHNYKDAEFVINETNQKILILQSSLDEVPKKVFGFTDIMKKLKIQVWNLEHIFEDLVALFRRQSEILNYKSPHAEKFIRRITKLIDAFSDSFELADIKTCEVTIKQIKTHIKQLLSLTKTIPTITLVSNILIPKKIKELEERVRYLPTEIKENLDIDSIIEGSRKIHDQSNELMSQFKWKNTRIFLLSYIQHLDSVNNLIELELEAKKIVQDQLEITLKYTFLALKIYRLLKGEINSSKNFETLTNDEIILFNSITVISKRILELHYHFSQEKLPNVLPSENYEKMYELINNLLALKKEVKDLNKSLDTKSWDKKNLKEEITSTKVFLLELEVLVKKFDDMVIIERHLPIITAIKSDVKKLEEKLKISSNTEQISEELDYLKEDSYSVWEDVTVTSQAKSLNEKALMFINRYRYEDDEISELVANAEIDYYNHDYEVSLGQLIPTLEKIKRSIEKSKIQQLKTA